MPNSGTNSRHPTSQIRDCLCGKCGATMLTIPGTKCSCGGLMRAASADDGMMRKAFGLEDTDLRKG